MRKLVSLKLKEPALSRLLASRSGLLHLMLALSVQSGLSGVDLTETPITPPPRKAKPTV
jgi:hypothetical protein